MPEKNPQAAALYEKGCQALDRQDFKIAADNFEKALKLDPKSPSIASNLGFAYSQLEAYEKAAQAYKLASELDKENPEFWFSYGYALFFAENYRACIEPLRISKKLLGKASPRNPSGVMNENFTRGFICLIDALVKLGELEQAKKEIQEFNSLFPKYPHNHYYTGLIALKENKKQEAEKQALILDRLDSSMAEQLRQEMKK